MNRVNIGSNNGVSPIRHQAIIWTNAVLFQFDPSEQTSVKSSAKYKIFIHENPSQNIVYEKAAILSKEDELSHGYPSRQKVILGFKTACPL